MRSEIEKVLICSTNHVTAETACKIDAEEFRFCAYNLSTKFSNGGSDCVGWLVWCQGEQRHDQPDELWRILLYAKSLGCEWVRFDRDASELDSFPTFDW